MSVEQNLRRKCQERAAGGDPYLSDSEEVVVYCCVGGDFPSDWSEGTTVARLLQYLPEKWVSFIYNYQEEI